MIQKIAFSLICLLLLACTSQEKVPVLPLETAETGESLPLETDESLPEVEDAFFDPTSISKEVYDITKTEVQALIENLNNIIRNKNFEEWVLFLSPEYRDHISSSEFLLETSESPVLKKQKIILASVEDYFINVVVPSRANDRVDDIEFIGQNRVKAYTLSQKGVRLRLYNLEKQNGLWLISN